MPLKQKENKTAENWKEKLLKEKWRGGKKRQNRRRDGKFMRDTEAETESEGQSDGHLKRQRQTEN